MTPGELRRPSIRTVLIASFLLVAALSVAFLAVQRYQYLTGKLLRDDLAGDLTIARAVAEGLDIHLAPKIHLINARARDFGASGLGDRTALARELDAIRRRNPSFASLLVADTSGVAIAFSPPVDAEGRPNVGRRYGDRKWFQDALRTPFTPSYDVVIGRALARPTVAIAAPIRDSSGEVIGVLSVALDLEEVHRLADRVSRGERGRVVVVDSRGRVISHSLEAWRQEAHDLSGEAVFIAAQREGEGSVDYLSSFTGERRWGSFVRVPATGWLVWVARGPEHMRAKVRGLVGDLAVSSVAAILISAVAAVLLSQLLSRPLRSLAEATRALSARGFRTEGLLAQRTSSIKEFDQLLAGFREMADALRTRYEDLEAKVAERTRALADRAQEAEATAALLRAQGEILRGYGELAALLNSLDRSHILEEGTKKIAGSLRSPLAAVYLTEDGAAGLRLKTYVALDPAGLDTTLLSPAGLPAEIARRREPVVLALPHGGEPLRLQTGVGAVEVAGVAGLPLVYQDRLLGVLVVALLEPLTDATRSFLENAARQLSVALNNAGLFESVRYQSQQLERLNAELSRASEVKSAFLASMSHELRTPLNSILGFTELLLASPRDPLSARQRTALEKVLGSGKHLLALINDVLDLSKIEAGRMEVRAGPVTLADLVRECLGAIEPQAQAKGLELRAVGLETAPEIVQDRGKVKQILLNLLSNAVKFTTAGSVEVRVSAESDSWVALAVADTGIGIRPEDQAAVFESFRQVESSETRAAGGTGLGLAISRRLAALLGGTLTFESIPDRGSVFTFRLPVRYSASAPPEEPEEATELAPGTARILVIDDDRDVVEIIRGVVAGEPLQVDWAASAAEGLARARRRRPAVILLDVILQGDSDGWEVLRALKADPATRDVPVVVHSVIDNPQRARALGADDVLAKPASPDAIKARLRAFLTSGSPAPSEARDGSV